MLAGVGGIPLFYAQGGAACIPLKVSDPEAVKAGVGGRDREQIPF